MHVQPAAHQQCGTHVSSWEIAVSGLTFVGTVQVGLSPQRHASMGQILSRTLCRTEAVASRERPTRESHKQIYLPCPVVEGVWVGGTLLVMVPQKGAQTILMLFPVLNTRTSTPITNRAPAIHPQGVGVPVLASISICRSNLRSKSRGSVMARSPISCPNNPHYGSRVLQAAGIAPRPKSPQRCRSQRQSYVRSRWKLTCALPPPAHRVPTYTILARSRADCCRLVLGGNNSN
jgi:hypothetical protein